MKNIAAVMTVFLIRWIDRRNREQRLVRKVESMLKEAVKEP